MCLLFYLFFVTICTSFGKAQITPCKPDDEVCLTKSAKEAYPIILAGDESRGVDTSDPLFVEEVDGTLSILNFKFLNITVTGYKECDIHNVKVNLKESTLKFNLTCPHIYFDGHYTINGRLIVLPVEGHGECSVDSKTYEIGFDATIKISKDDSGIEHMSIKSFHLDLDPVDGVHYDFKNLFNGRKDLADTVLKFANENWKEVAHEFGSPAFYVTFKKIIKNVNKYLKSIPLDQLFIL